MTLRRELPAAAVEAWCAAWSLPLAPGWGPRGPQPVPSHSRSTDRSDLYTVALDGVDVVHVEVLDRAPTAVITVTSRDNHDPRPWSRTITIAAEGEHAPA